VYTGHKTLMFTLVSLFKRLTFLMHYMKQFNLYSLFEFHCLNTCITTEYTFIIDCGKNIKEFNCCTFLFHLLLLSGISKALFVF